MKLLQSEKMGLEDRVKALTQELEVQRSGRGHVVEGGRSGAGRVWVRGGGANTPPLGPRFHRGRT